MKRLLLSGAILCSIPVWAFNVHFYANESSTATKSVANATKIIFGNDALTVVNADGGSVNVENSIFDYFKLDADASSIIEVVSAEVGINIDGKVLKVASENAISRVAIFAIDGKLMNEIASDSENVEISLCNLNSGVYIICVESTQGKLSKKLIID